MPILGQHSEGVSPRIRRFDPALPGALNRVFTIRQQLQRFGSARAGGFECQRWVVAESGQLLSAIRAFELHAPDFTAVLLNQQEQALTIKQGLVLVPRLSSLAFGI